MIHAPKPLPANASVASGARGAPITANYPGLLSLKPRFCLTHRLKNRCACAPFIGFRNLT